MSVYANQNMVSERTKKYFEANRNVLVVEDDKVLGLMVTEILEDFGFKVTMAPTGAIGLEKLQQQPIDFVILDVLLPEMDGFELYSKFQAIPDTKDIPVMIITAWSDEKNIEKASQLGIRHFLPKPFTEDELISTILTLLVDHDRQQE